MIKTATFKYKNKILTGAVDSIIGDVFVIKVDKFFYNVIEEDILEIECLY